MFAQLDSLPSPFPVEAPNVTLQTPPTCFRLKGGSPRVLFAIESFKQVEMVRRVVTRLEHLSHGFLLHTSSDVGANHTDAIIQLAASTPRSCAVRSGYVVYLSASDLRILFGTWQWLLEEHQTNAWDFFVSLSGSDYPSFDGALLNALLARKGNVSWRQYSWAIDLEDADSDVSFAGPARMQTMGLTCHAELAYNQTNCSHAGSHAGCALSHDLRWQARTPWLFSLVPEIRAMKSITYSSGGIFHRETLRFLVHDDRARAAFMFFRLTAPAAVEHYWATVYTLPDLEPSLSKDELKSCHMQWVEWGGRPVSDPALASTSNTYLDMSQWDKVQKAMEGCTPFLRKFDPELDVDVLDRIDTTSESLTNRCGFGFGSADAASLGVSGPLRPCALFI